MPETTDRLYKTENGLLLFDGATGTLYRSRLSEKADAGSGETSCEAANIAFPDIIKEIHRDYISAGANSIKTNSFYANSLQFPELAQLEEIIDASFELAESAARESGNVNVFADIGGISGFGKFTDIESKNEAEREIYSETAECFIKLGAKNFLFETMDDISNVLPAFNLIKEKVGEAVVMISFAASGDGYTRAGRYYKDLLESAWEHGFDIVGLNCVCGPGHMFKLIEKLGGTGMTLSAMPNSSYPAIENGRTVWHDNAAYFAEKISDMRSLGVRVLGGCCGTTPEHISEAAKILRLTDGQSKRAGEVPNTVSPGNTNSAKSRFFKKLEDGKKTIAVEIDPPEKPDASSMLKMASLYKEAGADIITLADSPLARVRADSFMTAARIKREIGIDTMPHLACRDRNRIAIQASLLAGESEGLRDVLVVTGDGIQSGAAPGRQDGEKSVFAFNSKLLIGFIRSLNDTIFIERPYNICGALNVNAVNFSAELSKAAEKKTNGCAVFLTQAIFSKEAEENLRKARAALSPVKILAGIMPIASYKNAVFLNNEVSGITIPDELIASLKDKDPSEVSLLSLAYSKNIIDSCALCCDGFYIMPSLRRTDLVCALIKHISQLNI